MPPAEPIPVFNVPRFVATHLHDDALAALFRRLPERNFCFIHRVEDFTAHVRFPVALNRTTYYALLLLERGTMTRSDGLQTLTLAANTLYCDAPGSFFGIDGVSPDCIGHFALFDADYLLYALKEAATLQQMPFFQAGQCPYVLLPPAAVDRISGLLQQAQDYLARPAFPDQQALVSTLLYLLLLMARQHVPAAPAAPPTAAAALVQRFQALAADHPRTPRSVTEYADLLAVSPRYLNRCVKQLTGQSVATLLQARLVREAQVLLRRSDLSVSAVAYQLGFDDLSYFARLIRRHTGLSPTAYRRQG